LNLGLLLLEFLLSQWGDEMYQLNRYEKGTLLMIVLALGCFALGLYIRHERQLTREERFVETGIGFHDLAAASADYTFGGYTSKVSVSQGESLKFYLSGTGASKADLTIYREGATRQLMTVLSGLPLDPHDCTGDYAKGCNWPETTAFTVPKNWPSGVYIAELVPTGTNMKHAIPFWVLEDKPGSTAHMLFLSSVNTHQAYNEYGGGSLYGLNGTVKSYRVSFDRPYNQLNGLGKYGRWEVKMVRWLEANKYPVEYAATYDLHFRPNLLTNYDVVIIAGHSEYWSWEMRQALKKFLDSGGRLINLSGNTMWWQIRYEDNDRAMVVYKLSPNDDPIKTAQGATFYQTDEYPIFDAPEELTGLFYRFGGYPPTGGGGYYIVEPKHWVFQGTNLSENQLIGKGSSISNSIHDHESDGLAFNCAADGKTILSPLGHTGTPANFTILGFVNTKDPTKTYNRETFAMMGIYTLPSGGAVFSAATTGWVNGLNQPAISKITSNVIDRFLAGNIPAEPTNRDATYYFYDRFNCFDIGRNRFGDSAWSIDIARYNFSQSQYDKSGYGIGRLMTQCGVDGSGLKFQPPTSTAKVRFATNLRPNWQTTKSLYSRFYLNLANLGLVNSGQFRLMEQSNDNRVNHFKIPAPVAELQIRNQAGTLQMRYQPVGANLPWVDVPAKGFFLVETGWDQKTGQVFLSVNGKGYSQTVNLSSTPAINRFDLGAMSVSGGFSGYYCLDELLLDGQPIGNQPAPTTEPTATTKPDTTPEPTATSTPTPESPPEETASPTPTTESPPEETETPVATEIPPNTATPTSVSNECPLDVPGNVIRNPGFEAKTSNWLFYTSGAGSFTATTIDPRECLRSAQVNIQAAGTNVQLYQTNIPLQPKIKYQLRLTARSTSGKDVQIFLAKHASPYTNYGLNGVNLDLTPEWQVFTINFTTSNFTIPVSDGRLRIWLVKGIPGEIFYFDEIYLTSN